MPVLDGLEATMKIREMERDPASGIHLGRPIGFHVPIIALTANAFQEDARACDRAGMDGFLSKPIDMAKIGQALKHWLLPKPPVTQTPIPLDSHKIIDVFLEDAPVQLSRIRKAIQEYSSDNPDSLHRCIHSLKGASGNIGAQTMHQICLDMEKELATETWDHAALESLMDRLDRAFQEFRLRSE